MDRARRRDLGTVEVVEEAVAEDRTTDQLARGQRQPAVRPREVLLARAQQPREAAYVAGVEAAERPEQQRLGPAVVDEVGGVLVVVVEVDRSPERVEEGQH